MDNDFYKNLREKLVYQETLDLDDDGVRMLLTELLDRDLPMKPILNGEYICPICDITIADGDNYCWHCGKAIDWS